MVCENITLFWSCGPDCSCVKEKTQVTCQSEINKYVINVFNTITPKKFR